MPYLAQLSKTQCRWLIGTLIVAVGIVAVGWISEPGREDVSVSSLTVEMSIREIAPKLDATGKAQASIALPNIPALHGYTIYSAYLVIDPSMPSSVAGISNALALKMTQ